MKLQEVWMKSHVREIPVAECRELLAAQRIGRVAFDDDSGPMVLPVNYALEGDTILFATGLSTVLAHHLQGRPVSFEVDDVDTETESGWSVVVRGLAEMVPHDQMPASEDRPRPWAAGPRPLVIRIRPHEISGRRLVPA